MEEYIESYYNVTSSKWLTSCKSKLSPRGLDEPWLKQINGPSQSRLLKS